MNTLRNSVQLIGRLGAEVETVTFDSGKTLSRWSVAVNESYKNKQGETVENTGWFNVQAWGKTAELASKILSKGDEVIIEGKLVTNSYETKEGEKRYQTNIEVREFLILSSKKVESEA